MASSPKVPYSKLKVHTGAALAPSQPAPLAAPARARFADLLRRRAAPAAPRPVRPLQPLLAQLDAAADDRVPGVMPLGGDEDPTASLCNATAHDASSQALLATRGDGLSHHAGPLLLDMAPDGAAAAAANAKSIGDSPAADHAIAQYLARTVIDFCNDRAVQGGDGWQVSMPLRADLLNATTLHLSLSRHWLLLRFVSHDERSRRLVLMHQKSLQTMLQETLEPCREVAITFD
jgi:hypothetical protein